MDQHLNDMRFWLLVRAASTGRFALASERARDMWKFSPNFLLARLPSLFILVARARALRFLEALIKPLYTVSASRGVHSYERDP